MGESVQLENIDADRYQGRNDMGEMEIKLVYKVVVKKGDGTLVSRTAGGIGWLEYPELTYKEGEITYAPEDSMGIFIDDTLEKAKATVKDDSGKKHGRRIIHEAIPLGKKLPFGEKGSFSASNRYPAILLGKEVWRDTGETWEDVTKECSCEIFHPFIVPSNTHVLIRINHGKEVVGYLGLNKFEPSSNYKIESPEDGVTAMGTQWFIVLKRVVG